MNREGKVIAVDKPSDSKTLRQRNHDDFKIIHGEKLDQDKCSKAKIADSYV